MRRKSGPRDIKQDSCGGWTDFPGLDLKFTGPVYGWMKVLIDYNLTITTVWGDSEGNETTDSVDLSGAELLFISFP